MSCRYAGVICRCRVVSPTVCPLLRSSLAMVVLRWFFIEVKLPQAMVVRERDHHALFFFLLHRRIRGFPGGKARLARVNLRNSSAGFAAAQPAYSVAFLRTRAIKFPLVSPTYER